MKTTFDKLGLSEQLLNAINQKGFEEPTDIQAMTIPVMLKNDTNIIAQAQTGTGKTAAFGLPLIELINPDEKSVQALILVPTRELAIQVSEEINSLKGKSKIKITPIYGGQSIDQQFRRLKKGVHIVVGTPGRVIDHLKRKTLKLGNIEHLILDEADEMLNMGFIDDMEEIMKHTNAEKRTLLFSATMPQKIKELAKKYMGDYKLLAAKKEQLTTNLTEQIYFEVKAGDKFEALCRIIDIEDDFYGLIFCRTKSDTDKLVNQLTARGYDAESIHSDISQSQRERTLKKFKDKRVNILVATDVAARGLDVTGLTHVINFSLPQDPESYVHRIGRTGRAGREGIAITFITPSEYNRFKFIQRIAKTDVKKSSIPQVEDIIEVKKKKVADELDSIIDKDIDNEYFNWAKKLLESNNPTQVIASLLSYSFENTLDPSGYNSINEPRKKESRQIVMQGKARLFVALGKKDDLNVRKVIELITSRINIKPKQISDIQVMEKFSFITVPFRQAELIIQSFKQKGKRPLITRAKSSEDNKSNPSKKPKNGRRKGISNI